MTKAWDATLAGGVATVAAAMVVGAHLAASAYVGVRHERDLARAQVAALRAARPVGQPAQPMPSSTPSSSSPARARSPRPEAPGAGEGQSHPGARAAVLVPVSARETPHPGGGRAPGGSGNPSPAGSGGGEKTTAPAAEQCPDGRLLTVRVLRLPCNTVVVGGRP
jgi:hypothetical protein